MATESLIDDLNERLQELTAYEDADLIRRPNEWGAINFESAEKDIRLVLDIAQDLSGLPLDYLTDSAAQQIIQVVPPVTEHLQAIDEFTLQGDPTGNRDSLTNGLRSVAEQLHATASPHIPYLAYRRGDIADNIAKLNNAVEDTKQILEQTESWTTERKSKVDDIVQAAQDAAAAVGVATFTQEFDGEATDLASRSRAWLKATAAFAAATILAAILFYFWPTLPADADAWDTLRNVVSKAAIIAVLFTGTVWCGRIYRALMHQTTVNRHRALSLKTFQAFVKSTDDPFVRDAVLMAATKTVFGNVPTGLVEQPGTEEAGVNFVEFGKTSGKIAGATTEAAQ